MDTLRIVMASVGWGILLSVLVFPVTVIILALPASIVWFVGDRFLHDDRETVRRRILKTSAAAYAIYLAFFVYWNGGVNRFRLSTFGIRPSLNPFLATSMLLVVSLPTFWVLKFYRRAFSRDSSPGPSAGWGAVGLVIISVLLTVSFFFYTLTTMSCS